MNRDAGLSSAFSALLTYEAWTSLKLKVLQPYAAGLVSETRSHYEVEAIFKFSILLLQPPEGYNYRLVL